MSNDNDNNDDDDDDDDDDGGDGDWKIVICSGVPYCNYFSQVLLISSEAGPR